MYSNGTDFRSLYINEVSTDFDFGSGDFTVDWWEYREAGNSGPVYCGSWSTSPSFVIGIAEGGKIISSAATKEGGSFDIMENLSMGNLIPNTWTHYALVRCNRTFYTFQNGALISTLAKPGADMCKALSPGIGLCFKNSGYYFFSGYLDEIRISKGIARWTSNFTLPTAPYSSGVTVDIPTNLTAAAGDSQVILSWSAVTGATGYNVKRSTTAGGPYTTIAAKVTDTKYVDTTVTNGTTYYYVVTALNETAESANSNEASATPVASSKAILQVTMIDSIEREYRVPTAEIDGFVNWYNSHKSTDTMSYAINDSVDSSKEYLSFNKIISFKVIPLNK